METLRLERKITNDSNTSYANYVTKVRSFRMFSLHWWIMCSIISKVSCDFAFSGHCLVLRAVNRRRFVITVFVDKKYTILDRDHSQKDDFLKHHAILGCSKNTSITKRNLSEVDYLNWLYTTKNKRTSNWIFPGSNWYSFNRRYGVRSKINKKNRLTNLRVLYERAKSSFC